jgi:hypothetical protein
VYGGDATILNAGASNGIVAADDGGTWAGCSGLELPYPPAPPVPLTLVAASYDAGAQELHMTFDHAVDSESVVAVWLFRVSDPTSAMNWSGVSAAFPSPIEVVITMSAADAYFGSDQLLNVPMDNGVVAEDDGGTWAGCSDRTLPF